jgi:hypothetical protein
MPATGLEVVGAAATVLATLELLRKWIHEITTTVTDYRDAGDTLLRLSDDLEAFETRWISWRDTWGIVEVVSDSIFEATWGKRWRTILAQVVAIEKICDNFESVLIKLVDGKAVKAKAQAIQKRNELRSRILGSRRSNVDQRHMQIARGRCKLTRIAGEEDSQALAQAAKKAVTTRQKLDFVFLKSAELLAFSAELRDRYNTLRDDAIDFFALAHPEIPPGAQLLLRREAISRSTIMQHVMSTKAASEALHWACLGFLSRKARTDFDSSANHCLGLELNLCYDEKDADSDGWQIYYHLTISLPGSTKHLDTVVRWPLQRTLEPMSCSLGNSQLPDFRRACAMIEEQSRPSVFEACIKPDQEVVKFQLTKQVEWTHKYPCSSTWLRGFLEQMKKNRGFPAPRKAELAFRIVENGLFLLGTSWLSYLDSSHIQRGDCGRFLLGTTAPLADNELKYIEPQTFHIGTLLAEIALSVPIDGIRRVGDDIDLVITSSYKGAEAQRSLPAKDVVTLVREESDMGFKYAKAVEFCLQQSGDFLIGRRDAWRKDWQLSSGSWEQRKQAYDNAVFADYFEQVYKP